MKPRSIRRTPETERGELPATRPPTTTTPRTAVPSRRTTATPRPTTASARLTTFVIVIAAGIASACADTPDTSDPDIAAFVTLLGDDTLAVEQFRRTSGGMEADVVLRTPRTTVSHYRLDLDDEGGLTRYSAVVESPSGETMRETVVTRAGDSLRIEITEDGEIEHRAIAAGTDALPFIDMVHWPFELMLTRAHEVGEDTVAQTLFTERGTMTFMLGNEGDGMMTATHPFRGTMDVEVDEEGRLQRLDAGATTRALVVTRVPEVDVEAIAEAFAARDAAGRVFGPLSGRGEAIAQVDGAQIIVDYGRPLKRGREIFGGLVPWNEVWRTGANQATHLETNRPLSIGELEVQAGRYTLFSIPREDGATLIVNGQTGQGGTSYDESQDLGRIEMSVAELPETVEEFTIEVEDTDAGGVLKLQWDRTEYSVPFTVEGASS